MMSFKTVCLYLGKGRAAQELIAGMEAARAKTDTRHMTSGVESVCFKLRIYFVFRI